MQVAVLPLLRKNGLPEKAKEVYADLAHHITAYYDDTGSIGKRYRRADEIGTPFAITIDQETIEQDTVTVRHRDSMKQDRVLISKLSEYVTQVSGV